MLFFYLVSVGTHSLLVPVSSGRLNNFSFWHFSVDFIFQQQVDGSY